jgi:hypothetical protein
MCSGYGHADQAQAKFRVRTVVRGIWGEVLQKDAAGPGWLAQAREEKCLINDQAALFEHALFKPYKAPRMTRAVERHPSTTALAKSSNPTWWPLTVISRQVGR